MGPEDDYASDRTACKFPSYPSLTSYAYGCRCVGCRKSQSANRARRKNDGGTPCNAPGCSNLRRRVSGARYCEQHARGYDYEPGPSAGWVDIECALCGTAGRIRKTTRYPICQECRRHCDGLIKQATYHQVPIALLVKWMTDPSCRLCGRDLYIGKGKGGACGFAIDHDHSHCSDVRGCAECVRGLLCGSCNSCLGGFEKLRMLPGIDRVMSYLTERPGSDGAQTSVDSRRA